MAKLIWQDSDDLGIAAVDAQHRDLFGLVNALAAAGGEDAELALNRLIIFTKDHFDQEARLFRDSAYPDADRHQKRHAFLLLILNRFVESNDRRPQDMDALLGFLCNWLLDHIRRDDRDYAAYVLADAESNARSA